MREKISLTKTLEELSLRYYNPENDIFENESVNYAITKVLSYENKEDLILKMGDGAQTGIDAFLDSINYKKTVKDEYEIYKEFLGEVFNNSEIIKNSSIYESSLNERTMNNLISARLRKEYFKDWENKDASYVYDFLEKYEGSFNKKMGKSIYYVIKNFPDNRKIKLLGENVFDNFLKYRKYLDNSEVGHFYEEAKKLIANFDFYDDRSSAIINKIAVNKKFKNTLIAAKLLKNYSEESLEEYMKVKELNTNEDYEED